MLDYICSTEGELFSDIRARRCDNSEDDNSEDRRGGRGRRRIRRIIRNNCDLTDVDCDSLGDGNIQDFVNDHCDFSGVDQTEESDRDGRICNGDLEGRIKDYICSTEGELFSNIRAHRCDNIEGDDGEDRRGGRNRIRRIIGNNCDFTDVDCDSLGDANIQDLVKNHCDFSGMDQSAEEQ